nr:MAG TPA: hypothetical protein [Caudoviricetes sp.]
MIYIVSSHIMLKSKYLNRGKIATHSSKYL